MSITPVPNPSSSEPWYVHLFGSVSGALVVIGSIGFVFAILYILHFQLSEIENSTKTKDITPDIVNVNPDVDLEKLKLIGQLYMESDAQFLRTERAQSLVAARLAVMIIAELVGLSLVVLGGAFIFARIRGESNFALEGGSEKRVLPKLTINSAFPGLLLCAFGSIVVIWALEVSIDDNAQIRTGDRPLFFPSESFDSHLFQEADRKQTLAAERIASEICRQSADDPSTCPPGSTD